MEDCRRRIEQLTVAIDILERENRTGADHRQRLDELTKAKSEAEKELAALEARWKEEAELVGKIREIRGRLEAPAVAAPAPVGQRPGASATAAPRVRPPQLVVQASRLLRQPGRPHRQDSRLHPTSAIGSARSWPI